MDKPVTPITKTCSICGQLKPLAAFLYVSGTEGSTYGPVCSDCRKAGLDKEENVVETDDSTRSTANKTLDHKAKLQLDTDKKQQMKEIEENYFEEREEATAQQSEHSEKKQNIADAEKSHRKSYIEKRSFLDSVDAAKRNASQPVFGGEEQKAREGAIRTDAPMLDTQIAGKLKYQGSVFNQFKTWLGNSAPLVKATTQPAAPKSNPAPNAAPEKPSLAEKVEKTWGPKRGR